MSLGRSGWLPPLKVMPKSLPPALPSIPAAGGSPGGGRESIPYYDPSRVVDLDKLKVVDDMRQQGTERGETQTGDNGVLGPQGNIAPGSGIPIKQLPGQTKSNNNVLWLALIAGALLLGG